MTRHLAPSLVLFTLLATSLHAQVRLPNIFGDHMVLQRGKPVRIWGSGKPNTAVSVSFAGQKIDGRVDEKGSFVLVLASMKASATGRDLVVAGEGGSRTLKDVLVGEVWVCGGQSNMEWQLRSSRDADVEVPSADYPEMRFIRMPKIARFKPQSDFPVENPTSRQGNWRKCIPEQVENCTGVGYYFGRRLHRRLRVPVGLIDTSWGGTMAQHWASQETLRGIPAMKKYIDDFEKKRSDWVANGREAGAKSRYEADLKSWEKKSAQAKVEGERQPRRPNFNSYTNPEDKGQPGGMMNGVIAPIARFTIRGALFYQGENNSFVEAWKPFPRTFPAVIAGWRAAFGDPDMPFGIVQIAGWSTRRSMTYDMNHHCNIVREVQFNTWRKTPNTGLIVTFDTNSNGSIHPGRKLPVGERSARWALSEVYKVGQGRNSKKPLEWRGPIYKSMSVEGKRIRVSFDDSSVRGLRLDQDVEVGFYIAGADRVFHHARVRVDKGKQLIVWNDDVKAPVAVRYGWSNLPVGGLMNARELPAYPFRTDTWPMVPHQSKGAYEVDKN